MISTVIRRDKPRFKRITFGIRREKGLFVKRNMMATGLALALAAPLVLNQVALAQAVDPATSQVVRIEGSVARVSDQAMWDAYFNSDYRYWDAKILADFWGSDVSDAKIAIGNKLLNGSETKAMLQVVMSDARSKALQSVDQLQYFFDCGFNYEDAQKLAEFWGEEDVYQSKLRIERSIILGNYDAVRTLLESRK